ncbi:MAG: AAA family ATPase [Tardiphaga sp.]|uniref:ATP-binding protein n=1 Tax=Tardiphaga sp. TaxID=1926292 RepID=UPI00198A3619|nr:AAA family ATPase [Tardiphaga sp.]MBC7584060.1 AAA family ATPase [Tardiphaga sp.]
MRIETLTLERYGIFTDRVLSFRPDAPLHVVLGANEAGKTSALSAIGDLLFGFGARTDYDFRHDSKTLRIGGAFRHADGRTLSVRRRKGNKNTLVDAADQPLPDTTLEPFLAGITRDIFAREFGLTAEALRLGGNELLHAGGSLAETLAAGSAGMTALSRVRDRLKNEADELFTPRKSASRPFYVAADRHEAAERALRDAVVTREALEDVEKAVTEAGTRLDALKAEHAASGSNLARWQRTLRVRSKLARLDSVAQELADLADMPEVPAQVIGPWREALAADAVLSDDLAAFDAADAADHDAMEDMSVDEATLAAAPAIDALRERLGAVRKAMEDLPRRREARRAAQEQLDAAAHRLGLPSHVELLERLPTDPALAAVKELIERTRRAEQGRAEAEAKRARVLHDIEGLADAAGAPAAISDPEAARQRLEALSELPTHADRLRRETSALAIEKNNLSALATALDPRAGDIADLAGLPLPDQASVVAHARAAELAEADLRKLEDARAMADAAIEAAETELRRLSGDGTVSTRGDLTLARSARDAELQSLQSVLDGDATERRRLFGDVERASQKIDTITDRLLTDTDRAARREAMQERLDQSRRERDRVTAALAALQLRRAEAEAAWRSLWQSSGLLPRRPAEMLRWRERVDQLIGRIGRLEEQQAELDALAAAQEAGKTAVIALLEAMGRAPDRSLPADILYREARSRLDELQKAWTDARARAVARQRAERDLAEAQRAQDQATAVLAEQAGLWPAALASIGLRKEASPAEAEAALAVWQSVPMPKLSFEREGRSVETIEADLLAFDRDAAELAGRLMSEAAGASAQESLARLTGRLAETRSAADACHRLREAMARRATQRKAAMSRRQSVTMMLEDARAAFGAADLAALVVAIERLARRHALQTEGAALRRELPEIADGQDEEFLRAEQLGLDLDALPSEIARETVRQNEVLKDFERTAAELHQKQRDFEALVKGRDAAAAAAERAESAVELVSVAERWLLRSAAAKLASLAIERHRAMVQDPLIEQASRLFALATGQAFAGLGVDYGEGDHPVLVAVRADGERVGTGGLSEGSRDQLFLALRLALLERRTHQPLPFIGDDLLTSFDEARTVATLSLLAEAGRQRQIIVFTHHQHVADLANAIDGHAIDVMRL